jgi:hypothetical protein
MTPRSPNLYEVRGRGEIGIRRRLKIFELQSYVGSNPTARTSRNTCESRVSLHTSPDGGANERAQQADGRPKPSQPMGVPLRDPRIR